MHFQKFSFEFYSNEQIGARDYFNSFLFLLQSIMEIILNNENFELIFGEDICFILIVFLISFSVSVLWLFLIASWFGQQCAILVLPGQSHLLFEQL